VLEDPVGDLVRKDSLFAKLGLDESDYRTPDAVVELLVERPRLMQRPVVVKAGHAIIGRPKSRVAGFLADP
jgi:arsenate reductase (glutaredoxin)